jgi:hypothetical protein
LRAGFVLASGGIGSLIQSLGFAEPRRRKRYAPDTSFLEANVTRSDALYLAVGVGVVALGLWVVMVGLGL